MSSILWFAVTQDLEERTRAMKMKFNQYRNSSSSLPASDSEASYRPRSRDRERINRNMPSTVLRDRMDRSYDRYRDMERHRKKRGRGTSGSSQGSPFLDDSEIYAWNFCCLQSSARRSCLTTPSKVMHLKPVICPRSPKSQPSASGPRNRKGPIGN